MSTAHAKLAVQAAKNLRKWGAFAATRFVEKRGVPWSLFAAAIDFEMRRGRAAA